MLMDCTTAIFLMSHNLENIQTSEADNCVKRTEYHDGGTL